MAAATDLVRERFPCAQQAWQRTAEVILDVNGCWRGRGKWLMRELIALEVAAGTTWAPRLDAGLAAALAGDTAPLRGTAEECLDLAGGRLWEGFHQAASINEVRPKPVGDSDQESR